jgi:hypothetical protein
MMMEGGGGGGMRGPNPHRDLGQLVRKMAMLKSQQEDAFTTEQATKLLAILQTLAKAEGMTAEEAESSKAELEGVLTEDQVAALEAIELPRRQRGGPGRPGGDRPAGGGAPETPGGTVATAAGPGAEGAAPPPAGGGGRGDWRAAMRARMLEIPYVKKQYDEQAAGDPAFATDEDKQNEFFRGLRGSLSPFLRGPSQEALQELIQALSPQA